MANASNDSELSREFVHRNCFNLDVNFDSIDNLFTTNIATAVCNSVFSLTAILGNALVLLTYQRHHSLHCPANTLLCCLALSDFSVGLITQPSFVAHKIGEIVQNFDIYCTTRTITETSGYITSGVSILTLTAISIERYLAMRLHLRYKEVITNLRTIQVVVSFWIILAFIAILRFLISNGTNLNAVMTPVLCSSFIITLGAYHKIYKYVQRHHRMIQDTGNIPTSQVINIIKYKRSTLTMAYILGLFVVCNEPFLGVLVAYEINGYTYRIKVAYIYASSCVFICSSFNPVIYCWRISEIRQAAIKTVKEVFSWTAFCGA